MPDFPQALVGTNHIEPAPRRIRAVLAHRTIIDTTRAVYVWEWPYYPQYYIPLPDVDASALVDTGRVEVDDRGPARVCAVRVGDQQPSGTARAYGDDAKRGFRGLVHVEWDAVDAWYEEDEQVFVHPRSPYARVDALRSTRRVRVELDGTVLAESSSPVLVFETGLPTRYYLNRSEVDFTHLVATTTQTSCPYKGDTSAYWSVELHGELHEDLAWSYDFPTRQLLPITGLVCFYNERVDIFVDGEPLERPQTHFS